MVCAIAPQDLFHCPAKQRLPHAQPSRLCVGSATPASKSPPRPVCRRRPSAAFYGGGVLTGSRHWNRPSRCADMNANTPANSSTSTSKSSANSIALAIGSPVTGPARATRAAIGWEFVHVCIDDASRIAFSRVMKDERKASAVAFLKAAVAYYASLGVTIERVMTDNGSCYRSRAFAKACKKLGLKHLRTKPYTPKTNGKAERFIQTSLREWAYARAYNTSDERAAELPRWLHRYNWHRPHGGIKSQTPISRLGLTGNNLLRLHS